MAARPLTFLWRRKSLDALLESYFVKETLLAALGRPLRVVPLEDDQPVPLGPDTLIGSLGAEMAPLLAQARARNVANIGLFHMADEEGKHDRTFYANADYVIRHYWFADALQKPNERSLGVVWAPNGYRDGLGPIDPKRLPSVVERSIPGFFAGAMSGRLMVGQREAMLRAVRAANLPFTVITTAGFGEGMGATAYAAWLSNARFALVPAGNSHETIRLYDALETGAIPVMVRSAFVGAKDALGALGTPPFLLLDSWDQLVGAYAPYAETQALAVIDTLEQRRQEIMRWWAAFKTHQQEKIGQLIERSFARSGGA